MCRESTNCMQSIRSQITWTGGDEGMLHSLLRFVNLTRAVAGEKMLLQSGEMEEVQKVILRVDCITRKGIYICHHH